MSNKYANLPDIDTAQDIYETDDVIPTSQSNACVVEDEEGIPSRSNIKIKTGDLDGLDSSSLISSEDATKHFRKAERRRDRARSHYQYPPSPTSPVSPVDSPVTSRSIPLSQRLRNLQTELLSLEHELADPANPQLHKERQENNVDPGELIRGLVDVRSRLDKIRKGKEGRGRLVGVVIGDDDKDSITKKAEPAPEPTSSKPPIQNLVEMDRRVGELEKLVGSSTAPLDELSPLPPPLLPQISRLNSQMTLLTQPRHIDSISRRLKLLLSDLDRASTSQNNHRRHPSQPSNGPPSQIQEQLLPLLSRLGPSLPQIPHILTRLRTLSALHASAGDFQQTLEGLEEEQRKMREALGELEGAVKTVEESLEKNRTVIKGNVEGLEQRVDALYRRLDELDRQS
ncbi:Dynamitin-domain-containing protein [Mycena floridula]|nr:Dynamitin-domain-containing protein [Mycena floridula]